MSSFFSKSCTYVPSSFFFIFFSFYSLCPVCYLIRFLMPAGRLYPCTPRRVKCASYLDPAATPTEKREININNNPRPFTAINHSHSVVPFLNVKITRLSLYIYIVHIYIAITGYRKDELADQCVIYTKKTISDWTSQSGQPCEKSTQNSLFRKRQDETETAHASACNGVRRWGVWWVGGRRRRRKKKKNHEIKNSIYLRLPIAESFRKITFN